MAQSLTEYLRGKTCKGFTPRPQYVRGGDHVVFFSSDELPCEERVDELLTLYRSCATGQIIGCKIKGVRRLLKEMNSFGVIINGGSEFQVGFLFMMAARQAKEEDVSRYKEAAKIAEGASMPSGELAQAA